MNIRSITPDPRPHLVRHINDTDADWIFMHNNHTPEYRPCFSNQLLNSIRMTQDNITKRVLNNDSAGIRHMVLASDDNVFNLGGDLELISKLIKEQNRTALHAYATLCIDVALRLSRLADDRVRTMAVVQGDALGGGFEAALCCNTIVAEEGIGMGFPEVLFDLFPGMGAYTFLARRVSPVQAERMMLNGKIYSSEELYNMGVVDVLTKKGAGISVAKSIINKEKRIGNALRAMNNVRDVASPVNRSELMEITTRWVDAALIIDERALRTMERLVRAQRKRISPQETKSVSVG